MPNLTTNGDNMPLHIRIFMFLITPALLYTQIIGFLCGVGIQNIVQRREDD